MTKKKMTYQIAFNELETIVTKLERNEVDIDQITTLVKRSNELTKFCKDKLRAIEEEIQKEE